MKNVIQNFILFLFLNFNQLSANVKLINENGNCLEEGTLNKGNIYIANQEKLSDGVCFYHIDYIAGFTKDIVTKFDIVVVDRKKPYRLRPIVDISRYTGKRKDIDKPVKNFGAFKSHNVMTFVKSRTKNIIAAINGPVFSFSNGKPHSIWNNRYEDGKKTEPDRTFLYGGLNLKNSSAPEPVIGMSSSYDKLDLKLFFHNIGTVKKEHNFSSEYNKTYTNLNSFIRENADLRNVGKSKKKNSYLNWAIGIKSGSFMGQVYIPKNNTEIFPQNAKHDDKTYGTKEKPRYWYDNVANGQKFDANEEEPIIAYNEDYLILGINLGDADVSSNYKNKITNKDIYLAFNALGMKYGAFLDGGGSTQMVIKGSDGEYKAKGVAGNTRAVFSALAVVKAYSDIDKLSEEYKRAIYYLTDFGIFGGDKFGKFGAELNITRAEFSKMIINLLEVMQKEITDGDLSKYKDINDVDWFEPYAKKVVGLGLMEGNEEKIKLSPNENITYWELSKIISIAFQGRNIKASIKSKLVKPKNGWHNRYLQCLNNYGKGYSNRFKEKYKNIFEDKLQAYYDSNKNIWVSKDATRKDVALFLYRAFILWQDGKFDDVSKSCVKK